MYVHPCVLLEELNFSEVIDALVEAGDRPVCIGPPSVHC
jgi:hypothetical protein